jgi:hypothetical protein
MEGVDNSGFDGQTVHNDEALDISLCNDEAATNDD